MVKKILPTDNHTANGVRKNNSLRHAIPLKLEKVAKKYLPTLNFR